MITVPSNGCERRGGKQYKERGDTLPCVVSRERLPTAQPGSHRSTKPRTSRALGLSRPPAVKSMWDIYDGFPMLCFSAAFGTGRGNQTKGEVPRQQFPGARQRDRRTRTSAVKHKAIPRCVSGQICGSAASEEVTQVKGVCGRC
ncbi:hypothetical protein DPEC_G00321230 [Dallia pectoralis]|uniref:Uncharacterized protein n=1 Tax=Dallia pectoralis TaxID=75939 RepID=A0ACC2FA36_DALPE|nr:hypothetical protein DPEC_G00321230 [Dallia pectoralis]